MTDWMKANRIPVLAGAGLVLLGIFIASLSSIIVRPGLELLLGIDAIVGTANVVHASDGNYYVTNPIRMVLWYFDVAIIGCGISAFGAMLIWYGTSRKVES